MYSIGSPHNLSSGEHYHCTSNRVINTLSMLSPGKKIFKHSHLPSLINMEVVAAVGAWAITALSSYDISEYSLSRAYFNYNTANIETELGSLLSPNASIIFPASPRFGNATSRWQEYKRPGINIVVEVATETDVQRTVCNFLTRKLSIFVIN